jgi:glucose-1-phosphate cytidylyltransferase
MTYGDGVSDIDISASVRFHNDHGKKCTVTAVTPPGRFGSLEIDEGMNVVGFHEKIVSAQHTINGGFFVLDPSVAKYIRDENSVWEQEPMIKLAKSREVKAWKHDGFWQPMDTLRDKRYLENLWEGGVPPWKTWT